MAKGKTILVFTPEQYDRYCGYEGASDDVKVATYKDVKFVYVRDREKDCSDNPYIGVQYTDGTYSICGCCSDRMLDTITEMFEYLREE